MKNWNKQTKSSWKSPKTTIELPTKYYVDNKFNDPSIMKKTDHVDFNDKTLNNVGWVKVIKMPAVVEHLTSKLYVDNVIKDIVSYIDNLHQINTNRRDLSSVFNDQDNEFDKNKLTNLDSITNNKYPSSDNELANKKYVDDSICEGNILRIDQTLQNYLKVFVGGDVYNLTKNDRIQIVDTTEIKFPNRGSDFLQNWKK